MHVGRWSSCYADHAGIAGVRIPGPSETCSDMIRSSRAGQINVAKPVLLDRSVVSYELSCSSEMSRYFSSQRMFVSYDADVSLVPNALLLIPLLSTLAPIAWALGADINAPCIDVGFLSFPG